MSYLDDLINEYRREVLNRESALQQDYVRRWRKIERSLKDKIDALVLELAAEEAAGKKTPRHWVHKKERYQSLLRQAQDEIMRFMQYADGSIQQAQLSAGQDGLDLGRESLAWLSENDVLGETFNHLNIEAVQSMIGATRDGTPLYALLIQDYPATIVKLTDALTEGVALGHHPKRIATAMMDAMAGNLQRAFSVARTEQMRVMRKSQWLEYQNSGEISEYERVATHDSRTCLACLLQDGRVYQINEEMGDHTHGRCLMLPRNRFFSREKYGRDFLLALDREQQIEMMGPERYAAWVDGRVSLDQMSRMVVDPKWGEAPRIVPMKELA
jgi:SPP1 gp7 family putative phage head morphogenesis protein